MEDEMKFVRCYRSLIDSYRLTPETSGDQLAAILQRVCPGEGPQNRAGTRSPARTQAGGTRL